MAGGTGGHVFPALSVAEVLRSRNISVSWLGTRKGIESELVPAQKFPIFYIDIGGLRGTKILKWLTAPYVLIKAIFQALTIIRRESPDVVLGLGGFASGPGGVAAKILRLPLIIHEQNSIAGTTNKLLAKVATRILTAFPNSLPRGEWTGNPVREEISSLRPPVLGEIDARRALRILVLGGSLGALAINQKVPLALASIEKNYRPEIRHQSGKVHLKETQKAYKNIDLTVSVEPFITDMAKAYEWADLVICRSGALTISELAAAGVAALLIPYPYAADDHQFHNGEWLVSHSAAYMVREEDLTSKLLASILNEFLGDRKKLNSMAMSARKLAKPKVAELVADVCMESS